MVQIRQSILVYKLIVMHFFNNMNYHETELLVISAVFMK